MNKSNLKSYQDEFSITNEKQLKPDNNNVAKINEVEKITMISLRLTATLQKRIKQAVVSDKNYGKTQNEFLIDAIEYYLDK